MLAHPIQDAPVSLAVDVSDYAMGAVLQQRANDEWQPLGFATKSLTTAQRKYSAYDRELLAMYTAIKRFRHAVEGRSFTIYADHKPLTYAFNQNLEKCSPRQFRCLDYIGQFTTDIRYIKGLDNNVADTLSLVESIGKSVDHRTLAAAQENDTEFCRIVNSANRVFFSRALRLKKIRFPDQDVEIYYNISGETVRSYVPKPLRYNVFNSLHELSHPGTRQCIPCQQCKVSRHVSAAVGMLGELAGRLEHIHIDIIVMQYAQGFRYRPT